MAQLNAFHAHILEACAQRDLTEPEALRQVKAMGYDGLECDCRQLTEERRQWFVDCGLKVASVYENYDFGYALLMACLGLCIVLVCILLYVF